MLADIHRCLDEIDLTKFAILELEMVAKYAVEGYALARINRLTPQFVGADGLGWATRLYHGMGPGMHGYSHAGGPWSGSKDPFGILTEGIRGVNEFLGLQ
jgi:hypothetical protein